MLVMEDDENCAPIIVEESSRMLACGRSMELCPTNDRRSDVPIDQSMG